MTAFAFYGTFTSGQPGHGNLAGATLVEQTRTAPRYRLYDVDDLPALVPATDGMSIECELYDVDEVHIARLAEIEPPGWSRAPLELGDGRVVEAFLAARDLAARGEDVSEHGGWPAYTRARMALQLLGDVRERRAGDLFPVAIGPEEGSALREWVRRERAVRTLETGLGFAVSTLFICEALLRNGPGARHVAADPYQHGERYRGVGLELLEQAGVRELVEFHAEESQILLPRLLADGRQFDFAFLDGNHRFEGVFLDLIYSGRLLKPGGVLFADDAQLPAVKKAIGFCVANLGWIVEDEGRETDVHEWTVLRTGPSELFQRPFDRFVEF